MTADQAYIFVNFMFLGFTFGLGVWLLAFAMGKMWYAFKKAVS